MGEFSILHWLVFLFVISIPLAIYAAVRLIKKWTR